MKTDVTKILNKKEQSATSEYSLDVSSVADAPSLPDGITLTSDADVTVTVKDRNNCMSLVCRVKVDYTAPCDRCLDEVKDTLDFTFEKTVSPDAAPDGYLDDATYDDVVFVSESSIDLDPVIVEEIALRLPLYRLCSEDCPGLCPKCGKNLKDGPCGCQNEKEIDPRLKKLQKLLDNFK